MRRPRVGQAGGTGSALSVTAAVALVVIAALAAAFAGVRCQGDDGAVSPPRTQVATATPTIRITQATTQTPEPPREFRVAFINLLSPLTLDANNQEAGDTFDERLDLVIKALKAYNPDLIAFNEASVTKAYGSAITTLAKELKMEFQYARANPWYPGQTKEQSDDLAKQIGFEEGELILSRYPIKDGSQRYALNPLTSESGEVRAALHVVVKGPGSLGDIDVYVTHLTGGSDKVRRAQVTDFTSFIASTRGSGPTIAMVGDPDISLTNDLYQAIGLRDVTGDDDTVFTCCRDSVIGDQPPLTGRADYLMYDRWKPMGWSVFGDTPSPRADGTLLYPSDHNGIWATFPVPPPASLP